MDTSKNPELDNLYEIISSINSKFSVRNVFENIETLLDLFDSFLEHGDKFYENHNIESSTPDEEVESEELLLLLINSNVKTLYTKIPALILFTRRQEPEYVEYLNEVQIMPLLERLSISVRLDKYGYQKMYGSEECDSISDLYHTLCYVKFVLENFEKLITTDEDPMDLLRQNQHYELISFSYEFEGLRLMPIAEIRQETKAIREQIENIVINIQASNTQPDKIKWLGTSTELAYAIEQLAYAGYIENPVTKDGEMNKIALARLVWQHIAPYGVKEDTFVVDLRGSRMSDNNLFAKAMNSIPTNPKIKKQD